MRGQDYDSESDSLKRDQTEEFCRQLVGTFPGALGISLVRRGRIERRWVSRGLAEITGYGVEELESQPDLHLKSIHPEDRPTIERAMLELEPGQSVHADYRVMHKNGETRWIREICTAGDQAPDGALPVIAVSYTHLRAHET